MNHVLLILHFVGLILGTSVSVGSIVMAGLIGRATPEERPVLGRFMPAISKVGRAGLLLLWVTGFTMAYTKWSGIASMPPTFHVKLTAVVLLTLVVGYIAVLECRVAAGDRAAAARIQVYGRLAAVLVLTIITFAVLTFD